MSHDCICNICGAWMLDMFELFGWKRCIGCSFSKRTVMTDWTNPKEKVSKYFTVKECLWLPQWNRLANESDGLNEEIKANLIKLCMKMDLIREFVGEPINVHVTYRPEAYNALIHGAKGSVHIQGMAMDFDVQGLDCDAARAKLMSKLDELELRMEDLPGSSWVHLDVSPLKLGGHRFFKP